MTLQNFTLGTFAQGAAGGGGAFESIATATGTGSANTITFTSIPGTYQHLQIRGIGKGTYNQDSAGAIAVTVNSDTSSAYNYHWLTGSGIGAAAGGSASDTAMWLGNAVNSGSGVTNMTNAVVIDVLDYGSTSKNKTFRAFDGNDRNGSGAIYLFSGLWRSTSAITSITLKNNDGNWTTSTTFALYGIKGA